MAAKKKTTTKQHTTKKTTRKAAADAGTVALVLRVPPDALAYIDANKGDRPRTAFVRDLLAKSDAKLAKILAR